MGTITNILEALRRIGSPTQRAALKRLDAQLEGKEVHEQRRRILRDDRGGEVEAFVATIAPAPETATALGAQEIQPLLDNAALAPAFIETFLRRSAANWTLRDLDDAFQAWMNADDRCGYSSDTVIQIAGAAFGQHCVQQLNMRWIHLSDADGTALAIDGIGKELRAFPFESVAKRIRDGEHGFFGPIFALLSGQAGDAAPRS